MKKIKILLSLCSLLLAFNLIGQNKDMREEALYFFEAKNYVKAYELYDKLYTIDPTNFDYKFHLGYSSLFYPEKKARAIEIFEDIKRIDKSPDADYYLAKAYHINYKFDLAIENYEKFIAEKSVKIIEEDKPFLEDAKLGLLNCKNGKDLILKKIVADIKNIGSPVNTDEIENGPVVSADQSVLIYTYVGKKSTGGLLSDNMKPDLLDGVYHEDIYMSTRNYDSTWSMPYGISVLNSVGNDAVVAISPDGNKLFTFVSTVQNPGDLYVSNKNGNDWSRPEKLNSNINSDFWEGSCSISSDGRFLFFASERPGGYGKRDLYISEFVNGDWGVAKNMGPVINTIHNEDNPFIHPDGITMFFASEGHVSIGGYDIMYSIKNGKDWTSPLSMGIPLNTTEDDRAYVITADGSVGYFSSNRGGVGGKGGQDIYMVTPGILGEKPVLALLKGSVFANDKPVAATIEILKTETNQEFLPYYSNSITGKFLLALSTGNTYKIRISVQGFTPVEENITIDNVKKFVEIKKDFYVYSTEFLPKKENVSIKTVLDSIIKDEANQDAFKNDLSSGNSLSSSNSKNTPENIQVVTKTEKTKGRKPVKPVVNDTLKEPKASKLAKAVKSEKGDPKVSEYVATQTQCSGTIMPDLSAIKGKSLNDPLIYKQLLDIAGSICIEGVVFKVQIGAYRMPKNFTYNHLKKFGSAEVVDYPDGITRFTQLSFKTLIDAEKSRQQIIGNGQKDAWITAFIDGKRYTLEELIAVNFNNKQIN